MISPDPSDDSPIFWELVTKYGNRFDESPWSPEFLEIPAEPGEHWPVTFDGALEHVRRRVAAQYLTREMPLLALDQYAQEVDLSDERVTEIIEGVLVHD